LEVSRGALANNFSLQPLLFSGEVADGVGGAVAVFIVFVALFYDVEGTSRFQPLDQLPHISRRCGSGAGFALLVSSHFIGRIASSAVDTISHCRVPSFAARWAIAARLIASAPYARLDLQSGAFRATVYWARKRWNVAVILAIGPPDFSGIGIPESRAGNVGAERIAITKSVW
jgi:hypothetical protein